LKTSFFPVLLLFFFLSNSLVEHSESAGLPCQNFVFFLSKTSPSFPPSPRATLFPVPLQVGQEPVLLCFRLGSKFPFQGFCSLYDCTPWPFFQTKCPFLPLGHLLPFFLVRFLPITSILRESFLPPSFRRLLFLLLEILGHLLRFFSDPPPLPVHTFFRKRSLTMLRPLFSCLLKIKF